MLKLLSFVLSARVFYLGLFLHWGPQTYIIKLEDHMSDWSIVHV